MRQFRIPLLLCLLAAGLALSCKKWQDPEPVNDPRLTNPYCNDPAGVNYNWGFPGRPDNTTCFYPSDLFAGSYTMYDTVYSAATDLYLLAITRQLVITKISQTKITVEGMCEPGQLLQVTAGARFAATVDTTVGDSLTLNPGQFFCRQQDTVTGTFTRDRLDSSLVYIDLKVMSDTGATVHRARAIKKM